VAKVQKALETSGILDMDDIFELAAALNDDGQFLMITQLLEQIPKVTAAEYLLFGGFELVQEAAARTDRGRFLLDLYGSLQKVAEVLVYSGAIPRFQWAAAIFARQALGDLGLAKKLLTDMIDHPACTDSDILGGCNQLTEIMLEEFRLSSDPKINQQALDITLKLLETPAKLLSSNDYEPRESHILITAGIMLRRLGPSQEFQNRLDAAFRNCMDELQDKTGCNDLAALRRLARVLSCVPGFG
jgi:predicted phosphatase